MGRLLVERFYFLNSGFFLVLFLLLFGVIDPASTVRLHIDLIVMMGAKPALLAAALGLLGLYYLKCLRFALQQIGVPENEMLYQLQALPGSTLRRYLSLGFTAMYAPALGYGTCIVAVSLQHGAWVIAGMTAVTQAALVALAARLIARRIMERLRVSRTERMLRKLDALRPAYLGFMQYFTAQLLTQKKMLLLLLKTGSLLLLQLMVYINRDEPERAGTFYVLLFLIVAHGLLPWHLSRFSEGQRWLRNLPVPVLRRYAAFAGTYALLFVPELAFLLLHVRDALGYADMLSFYVLSVSMLCGLHAVQYVPGLNMDRYLMLLLFVFLLSMIALAIVSPWTIAGFWLLVSVPLFSMRYYRSELEE